MTTRLVRCALVALSTIALAAGCGDDDDDTAPATTTTSSTATTTTPTTTSTTTAAPACGAVSVPEGATGVTEADADVDGDGAVDELRGFRTGSDDWHLQVTLSTGGGADLPVTTSGGSSVIVLGGADVDGDGGAEVWAQTGSGASATILGLAKLVDCELRRVTLASGEPAELAVGGSVGTASGVACDAHIDPTADLTAYTATNMSETEYEVTATEFALEGTTLVERASDTGTATVGDETFARATSFTCDDLSL